MAGVNKVLATGFALASVFFMLAAIQCASLRKENKELCVQVAQLADKLAVNGYDDRQTTIEFAKLRVALATAQMDAKELTAERDSYEAQCKAMRSMLNVSRHALRVWRREHGEPDIEISEPQIFVAPAKE